MDCDIRDPRLVALHPNPIGLLYEICSKSKNDTPKFTCISSNTSAGKTEFVMYLEVFSLSETGLGRKKNDAKADAAFKVLIKMGHLQTPDGALQSEADKTPAATLQGTSAGKGDQVLSPASITTMSKTRKRSLSVSFPPFNASNPLLNINWILKTIGQELATTEYTQVEESATNQILWLVECSAKGLRDMFLSSAKASGKKAGLRQAAEQLYQRLVSDQDIIEKFSQYGNSQNNKANAKKQETEPPGWSVFRHAAFLPENYDAALGKEDGELDSETEVKNKETPNDPEKSLKTLARDLGFTYQLVPWFDGSSRRYQRKKTSYQESADSDGITAMMAHVHFKRFPRPPLCIVGSGPTKDAAIESTCCNIIKYFNLMQRAHDMNNAHEMDISDPPV